jgi:hypothetical protein
MNLFDPNLSKIISYDIAKIIINELATQLGACDIFQQKSIF